MLSSEDVIPRWLTKELQELVPGMKVATFTRTDWRTGTVWNAYRPRSGRVSVKHRSLCETCNNQWLSDLEGDVRPLVRNMMQGKNVELAPKQQRDLAFWCAKTAMTYDTKFGGTHVPREHVDWIYQHRFERQLWSDARVGLAWYVGGRLWEATMSGLSEEPFEATPKGPPKRVDRKPGLEDQVSAYLWTARFAQLIVQVSGHWPGVLKPPVDTVELPGYSIGVWPISALTRLWPPPVPMNDRMYDMYARADHGRDAGTSRGGST